jgi:hypothetical protein
MLMFSIDNVDTAVSLLPCLRRNSRRLGRLPGSGFTF